MILFIIPFIIAGFHSETNPNPSVTKVISERKDLRNLQKCHMRVVFLLIYNLKVEIFEPIEEVLCDFLKKKENFG